MPDVQCLEGLAMFLENVRVRLLHVASAREADSPSLTPSSALLE